jgi:hypothetical protein
VKTIITIVSIIAVVGLVLAMYVSANNSEVRLRNAITAKQEANKATFDNMWKQISQVAQVTTEQKNALREIFENHAKARQGGSDDKLVMKWIKESIPNVDTKVYTNLQNIIVSARNSFTNDQVALLDLKREHDNVRTMFPSSLFVGGRPEIKVTLVTSGKTEAAFASGRDDDVNVFGKAER